jgi:hypothetical protein
MALESSAGCEFSICEEILSQNSQIRFYELGSSLMRSINTSAAEKALAEIERVLNEYTFGCPNEEAKRKIQASITTIRSSVSCEGYLEEKLGGIEERLDTLYSARKHEKFPGGANGLKIHMLSLCSRISDALPMSRNNSDK